jgi:ubiquinone/menaquinone biosynthesis C-methylase UbiE
MSSSSHLFKQSFVEHHPVKMRALDVQHAPASSIESYYQDFWRRGGRGSPWQENWRDVMSQDQSKDRQQWAVDCMAIRPRDQVLEIGCGTGPAVTWVCEKLKGGRLLAVDRSRTMIQKAMIKSKSQLVSAQVTFRSGAFAALDWEGERFDKVFSFNVNVFWMKPAADLAVLREVLAPRGAAFFFYSPPDLTQLKKIKSRLPELLQMHGFAVQETFEAKLGSTRTFGLKAVQSKLT